MPVSAKSLHARGLISDRQMKLGAQKGTHSQPSKMAPFEAKRKAEGAVGNKGMLKPTQINTQGQSKSKMSKGARVNADGQLHKNQISDASRQQPKFPAGHKMKGRLTKPAKLKGTRSQRTGNVYDTPDRNGFR